ncbi:MAG: POTRA domain-containing protein [Bacteroidales bacterium]
MKKASIYYISLIFLLFLSSELKSENHSQISNIIIIGNSKIKDFVILRELPFKKGDTIEKSLLNELVQQGRDNLLNLSLFNFVYISQKSNFAPTGDGSDEVEIIISVDERWYFWPIFGFSLEERNFSNWIKDPVWDKITTRIGLRIYGTGGKNQTITALLMNGYNNGFKIEFSNISLDKEGRHFGGISVQHKYSKILNTISLLDKPVFIRADKGYLENLFNISLSYIYRPRPRIKNRIILEFESTRIDSTVLISNSKYWGGDHLKRESFMATYGLTFDERDNIQYPLNGYYVDFQAKGYVSSGLEVQHVQIKGDVSYFTSLSKKLSASARVQCAFSAKNCEAYIFDKALGYGDLFLRGFENFISDGQHYMLLSPTLRFNILPTTVYNLKFLSFLPKFNKVHMTIYGKTFADAGYVYHKTPLYANTMSNKWLVSYGLGVDVVTYYDLTFSLDYSINQMRQKGLFLSVKRPLQ